MLPPLTCAGMSSDRRRCKAETNTFGSLMLCFCALTHFQISRQKATQRRRIMRAVRAAVQPRRVGNSDFSRSDFCEVVTSVRQSHLSLEPKLRSCTLSVPYFRQGRRGCMAGKSVALRRVKETECKRASSGHKGGKCLPTKMQQRCTVTEIVPQAQLDLSLACSAPHFHLPCTACINKPSLPSATPPLTFEPNLILKSALVS